MSNPLTSIVDQDIDASKFVQRGSDDFLGKFLCRHIARNHQSFSSILSDE